MTEPIPGDLAIQLAKRACQILADLGIPTGRARHTRARWRMHPDAVRDMQRSMHTIKIGAVGMTPINESVDMPDVRLELLGMPIVEDDGLAVTALRFEAEA